MKTFDRKDVYSWSNAEDAKQYIGKAGYFADYMAELQTELINSNFATLRYVFDSKTDNVDHVFSNGHSSWGLFLPADKVKVKDTKKWRPFKDHNEFKAWVGKDVGETIHTREISSKYETEDLITELNYKTIRLASTYYNYDELFNQYEWKNSGHQWQPFGVKE